jgi:[ribosomal protein S5]-alanine N-acetyltransferase
MEPVETKRLKLVPQTREEARRQIEEMAPHERAEVSAQWLARLEGSNPIDPWIHGFRIVDRVSGGAIGSCGFKGPPGADGAVEIAYGVAKEHERRGYASEAAEALVKYAFDKEEVQVVRAHTLPEPNASTRVLKKCGFRCVGEVIDPEDGLVWRWERIKSESTG